MCVECIVHTGLQGQGKHQVEVSEVLCTNVLNIATFQRSLSCQELLFSFASDLHGKGMQPLSAGMVQVYVASTAPHGWFTDGLCLSRVTSIICPAVVFKQQEGAFVAYTYAQLLGARGQCQLLHGVLSQASAPAGLHSTAV